MDVWAVKRLHKKTSLTSFRLPALVCSKGRSETVRALDVEREREKRMEGKWKSAEKAWCSDRKRERERGVKSSFVVECETQKEVETAERESEWNRKVDYIYTKNGLILSQHFPLTKRPTAPETYGERSTYYTFTIAGNRGRHVSFIKTLISHIKVKSEYKKKNYPDKFLASAIIFWQ